MDSCHRQKLNERLLYATCEEECHEVSNEGACVAEELNSTQEEAVTQLLLHAQDTSRHGSKSVVIVSEDTDVIVLCLAFHHLGPSISVLRVVGWYLSFLFKCC